MAEAAFFNLEDDWFVGTAAARSPWHPGHCHAGPVLGAVARAAELGLAEFQIARLTVDLVAPPPMAGFRVESSIRRQGRTVAIAESRIVDREGAMIATASSTHIREVPIGDPPTVAPDSPPGTEDPEEATPSPLSLIGGSRHDLPCFSDNVELRYPEGHEAIPGPKIIWMRTPPLIEEEIPSAFQRLCPLADCGNGISRNAELSDWTFINADVTVVMHRAPVGDWLRSEARSHWQPNGIGLAEARLGDKRGPVATALQTLIIRPQDPVK